MKLFTRLPAQGLVLSSEGKNRLELTLRLLADAQKLYSPESEALKGEYRIGYLSTLGSRYVAGIVSLLKSQYPDIKVQLIQGDSGVLIRQVENREIDVALVYDLGTPSSVDKTSLAKFNPYVLVSKNSTLAAKKTLHLKDLCDEPFIMINLSHSRDYFMSLFLKENIQPSIAYEVSSLEMVRALVANEQGIALLTTRPVIDFSHDGLPLVCIELGGSFPYQEAVLLFPVSNRDETHFRKAFTEASLSFFRDLA